MGLFDRIRIAPIAIPLASHSSSNKSSKFGRDKTGQDRCLAEFLLDILKGLLGNLRPLKNIFLHALSNGGHD